MTNLVKRNAYAEGRECAHDILDRPHAGSVMERYRDAAKRAIVGDVWAQMVAAREFDKGFMQALKEEQR